MNPTAFRTASALALLLSLSACSNLRIPFISNQEEPQAPYAGSRSAISGRSLEMPPDLTAPEVNAAYDIPGLSKLNISASGQKVLEAGTVLPKFDKVRMESAGGQRWLVISAPADVVWPQARQFWLDQGFALKTDSAALGLLETNFKEQKPELPIGTIRAALQRSLGTLYSTGLVDQYRMRLERSADGLSTEIYISHQGMEEVYTDRDNRDTRWTPRKPEPEREAEMLKKLLLRFGVTADVADKVVNTAAAAPSTGAPEVKSGGDTQRAQLTTLDGKPALRVFESFDRAWRRVGLALERAGYVISDRDRQLGVYYVRSGILQLAKDDSSLWDKLAFWKDDSKKSDDPKGPEYLVVVSGKDSETTVKVSSKDGSLVPDATANALLQPLANELR